MKKTFVLLIAVVLAAVMVAVPVLAANCTVPPDEYFLTDSALNGQPVHDGPQLGHVWWITERQGIDGFVGNHYLGFSIGTYAPGKSKNEQDNVAFARMAYCYSLPDYAYKPNLTAEQYVAASPYGVHEYPKD